MTHITSRPNCFHSKFSIETGVHANVVRAIYTTMHELATFKIFIDLSAWSKKCTVAFPTGLGVVAWMVRQRQMCLFKIFFIFMILRQTTNSRPKFLVAPSKCQFSAFREPCTFIDTSLP